MVSVAVANVPAKYCPVVSVVHFVKTVFLFLLDQHLKSKEKNWDVPTPPILHSKSAVYFNLFLVVVVIRNFICLKGPMDLKRNLMVE